MSPPPPAIDPHRFGGRLRDRALGLLLLAAGATVLFAGRTLTPDPDGIGTHTALGLSPCGFLNSTGLPCATCGMTTATALAARGRLVDSALTQPAGFAFALTCALAVLAGAWITWRGTSLRPVGRALLNAKPVAAVVGLILLGWIYKAAAMLL